MEPKTTLSTIYVVSNSSDEVTLDLIVKPEGQTATSEIKLDSVVLSDDETGSVYDFPIGPNAGIKDRKMVISTTISNTTDEEVEQELVININGGVIPFSDTLGNTVDAGDSETYYIEVDFIGL